MHSYPFGETQLMYDECVVFYGLRRCVELNSA